MSEKNTSIWNKIEEIYETEYAKVLAYITSKFEETFLSIIKDYVIKEDKKKYPNSIFYLNADGKVLFELKKSTLWCNWDLVWSVFYERYGMNYSEMQDFIKDMADKHFKMSGVTPHPSSLGAGIRWRNISKK